MRIKNLTTYEQGESEGDQHNRAELVGAALEREWHQHHDGRSNWLGANLAVPLRATVEWFPAEHDDRLLALARDAGRRCPTLKLAAITVERQARLELAQIQDQERYVCPTCAEDLRPRALEPKGQPRRCERCFPAEAELAAEVIGLTEAPAGPPIDFAGARQRLVGPTPRGGETTARDHPQR